MNHVYTRTYNSKARMRSVYPIPFLPCHPSGVRHPSHTTTNPSHTLDFGRSPFFCSLTENDHQVSHTTSGITVRMIRQ